MDAMMKTDMVSSIQPRDWGLFGGGAWSQPGVHERMAVASPSTGEALGTVARGSAADVDGAVAAAAAAFPDWAGLSVGERVATLKRAAARLEEHAEELALIDAVDSGNPYAAMLRDVRNTARRIDNIAALATEVKGTTVPTQSDVMAVTLREPLGVVVRIGAFNHPLLFTALKAVAPLVVGNTLIVKPSEQAPLSSLRLAELWHDVFPPGVFNVVTGDRETGAAFASHPGVAMVGLIGSLPAGRAVARAGADTLKHLVLELGGKNPLIVFPDADLEKAAAGIAKGMSLRANAGQSCQSTSRIFAHAEIYDRLLELTIREFESIKVGLPASPATEMGCLISQVQLDRVMTYIRYGHEDGARLATGGKRIDAAPFDRGFFVEPTIFADVTMEMRIAREEIFGPIVSFLKWQDEDKVLAEANALDYGLSASIWTKDLSSAMRTASRIESGYVWINDTAVHYDGLPFGGYKQSGKGREESIDELFECTRTKSIVVKY